jgi:hypothetical protein
MGSSKNKENETTQKRKAVDFEGDDRECKPRKLAAVFSMLDTRLQASKADSYMTESPLRSIAQHHARTPSLPSPRTAQTAGSSEQLARPGSTISLPHMLDMRTLVDGGQLATHGNNEENLVDSFETEVQNDFINDISELYDDVLDAYSADAVTSGNMLDVSVSQPLRQFCSYNGASCACTANDHQYDSTLSSNSISHVDDNCQILRVLNLKFHKRHRYLICSCHGGSFLAFRELKDHLKKKHRGDIRDGNTRTMKDFPSVVDHISTSFGISITQQSRDFSKEDFDGPIAGIREPLLFYPCPSPSCTSYCVSMFVLKKHHQQTHGTALSSEDDVVPHWTQFPFAPRISHARRVEVDMSRGVPFASAPETTNQHEPSIPRYITPHGITAPTLPWLDLAGWTTWREEQLRNNHTVSSLRAMITLERATTQLTPRPLAVNQFLRVVGDRIRARAIKMLKDANIWLGNSELRSAITAGYDCIPFISRVSQ